MVDVETAEPVAFTVEVATPFAAPALVLGRVRWMPEGDRLAYVGVDERSRTGIFTQDFPSSREGVARPDHGG